MEQHGRPPLVLSFESIDGLDHVIFVYSRAGRWGSVARSRDPGLHGRRAGLRYAARARPELRRPLRRSLGTRDGLRRRRPAGHGRRTTGGCRIGTSGRSSGCCSTTRTAASAAPTRASVAFARATGRSSRSSRISSRSTTERRERWTRTAAGVERRGAGGAQEETIVIRAFKGAFTGRKGGSEDPLRFSRSQPEGSSRSKTSLPPVNLAR